MSGATVSWLLRERIVSFNEMKLDCGDKFLFKFKADIWILKITENK